MQLTTANAQNSAMESDMTRERERLEGEKPVSIVDCKVLESIK